MPSNRSTYLSHFPRLTCLSIGRSSGARVGDECRAMDSAHLPTESIDMTSVFSAPSAHDSHRRRVQIQEDAATKESPRFRDLTVLLISEDEEEAFHIRHVLPVPFVRSMVWHTNAGEAGPFLAVCRGPICVLVGRSASGARPAEIARRLRRSAPYAAVLLL